MTQQTLLTEERLVEQAIAVLIEKLGILETERFLALKAQARLDSVPGQAHIKLNLGM